jgi:hypothetical protein
MKLTDLVSHRSGPSSDAAIISNGSARDLYRYWETVRGADAAPTRANLDLRSIFHLAPNLFIIEEDPSRRHFKWRLAGTDLHNIFGQEITGRNALAGWGNFECKIIRQLFENAINGLQPFVLRYRAITSLEQTINIEMIGVPVLTIHAPKVQILGGLFALDDISSLSHRSIAHFELLAARSIWTEPLPGDALIGKRFKPALARAALELIMGGLKH